MFTILVIFFIAFSSTWTVNCEQQWKQMKTFNNKTFLNPMRFNEFFCHRFYKKKSLNQMDYFLASFFFEQFSNKAFNFKSRINCAKCLKSLDGLFLLRSDLSVRYQHPQRWKIAHIFLSIFHLCDSLALCMFQCILVVVNI